MGPHGGDKRSLAELYEIHEARKSKLRMSYKGYEEKLSAAEHFIHDLELSENTVQDL